MQLKPILNGNSNFDQWSAGNPTIYSVAAANGDVHQLNRHDQRSHPQRAVFPKKMKSSDYVFDGNNSFRFTDGGAGTGTLTLSTPQVPVEPGQLISCAFAYRFTGVAALSLSIPLRDAIAGSTIAAINQEVWEPFMATPERMIQGNPGTVALDAAPPVSNIPLVVGGEDGGGVLYWTRYGITARMPMGVRSYQAAFSMTFVAKLGASFDAGEIRIEVQEGRTHAGG